MSGMNQWLAQMYNTPGAPTQEDLQKVAEAELFSKLAAENGLDLNSMTDDEVADLWNKTAGEMPPQFAGNGDGEKKDEKDEKPKEEEKKDEEKEEKEAAAQEWAMQKAASDQIAFMDYCGRVMAHAYVNELTKIGQSMAEKDGSEKTASAGAQSLLSNVAGSGVAASTASSPTDVNERIQKLASGAPPVAQQPASTERIDYLGAKHAVKLAAEAGIDPNVAAERLNAVLTLGPQESTKIAAAQNVDQAIEIRGLELLEQAGFEVNWS